MLYVVVIKRTANVQAGNGITEVDNSGISHNSSNLSWLLELHKFSL